MTGTPKPGERNDGEGTDDDYERQLISKIIQKDEQAFQQLMDLHIGAIRKLVDRLMAFDVEAEDVVQHVFLTVWRKAATFRGDCALRTWLTRIAIRQTRNQQRSVTRWWKRAERLWSVSLHGSKFTHANTDENDPRWEHVQMAMKKLSHSDREILVWIYLENQTIADLASLTNEKMNTLEVRLHRAKQRLKNLLLKQGPPT